MFEALRLNAEAVSAESETIRHRSRSLAEDSRKLYFQQYKKKIKDPDTYAVLNWFFLAGLHHMYLEKYARGMINLGLLSAGVVLLFTPFNILGLILIALILGIELMALFRAQVIVANYNNQVAATLLDEFEQA